MLTLGYFFFADSGYQSVKQALHTAVPERLLSRETERAAIVSFLKNHVVEAKPSSLYISGAPGTGKTACLNCVLQERKVSSRKNENRFCTRIKMGVYLGDALKSHEFWFISRLCWKEFRRWSSTAWICEALMQSSPCWVKNWGSPRVTVKLG